MFTISLEMPTAISVGISNTQNENELKIVCKMNSKIKTKERERKRRRSPKHMNDNQLQCNLKVLGKMFEIVRSTSRQWKLIVSRILRLFIVFVVVVVVVLPSTLSLLLLLLRQLQFAVGNYSWNLFNASFRPRSRHVARRAEMSGGRGGGMMGQTKRGL